MVLEQGKLYKFSKEIPAIPERDFDVSSKQSSFYWDRTYLPSDTVFLFLGMFLKDHAEFSKILVKETIHITYNPYLLQKNGYISEI